jgi:hypothetical protein
MLTSSGHENNKLIHVGLHPGIPLEHVSAWVECTLLADTKAGLLLGKLAVLNVILTEAGDPSSLEQRQEGFLRQVFPPILWRHRLCD